VGREGKKGAKRITHSRANPYRSKDGNRYNRERKGKGATTGNVYLKGGGPQSSQTWGWAATISRRAGRKKREALHVVRKKEEGRPGIGHAVRLRHAILVRERRECALSFDIREGRGTDRGRQSL